MRVSVSLGFDILIESFISLCIMETVGAIVREYKPPKERAEFFDDFDHCVIKRTIHGLYSRTIAPTVSIIHKEIKDSIKISKPKLTLTLIDLGHTKCKTHPKL
jgi:hypothetical protein